MDTKRRLSPGGALRARCPLRLGDGGQQDCASADAGGAGAQAPGQPSTPQGEGWVPVDAGTGRPARRGQAVAAGSASRPARGGEGPVPPAPPPRPGGREGRPWAGVRKAKVRPRGARPGAASPPPRPTSRPSPHLGGHRQVLRRRLQLQHRVRLPVGQRRLGVRSPIPEGQLLSSVPLRRRLGRQQQRRLRHRRGPRGPLQQRGGGDPTERPGPLPGEPGLPALHRQRGGPRQLTRIRFRSVGGTEIRTDVALHPLRLFPVARRSQRAKAIDPNGSRNAPTGSLNINNFIVRGVHDNCAEWPCRQGPSWAPNLLPLLNAG